MDSVRYSKLRQVSRLTSELEECRLQLAQSEEKYDRCIVKAKTVLANLNDGSSEAALRHEISEKNQLISKLERDVAQMRSQYDSQVGPWKSTGTHFGVVCELLRNQVVLR